MEALSGVASVISIVTLALQSTKVIYEVGSSISHGSDDIDRLVRATGNLEKLLEVVKRLAVHAERTNSVAEGKLLEDLKQPVEHCANALSDISVRLLQLQKDPKDRRWMKAKKYARVYLDTKGITEIWNTVNHCVELLGACLGNASVDVGLYNAHEAHLLHDELSAASRDSKDRLHRIEEVLRDQRALAEAGLNAFRAELHRESVDARVAAATQIQGIADIRTEQQQFREAITVGYERIADIQADVKNLRAAIDDGSHQASLQSEAFMTDLRGGISEVTNSASGQVEAVGRMNMEVMESISDRLKAVPSMASEQLSILQNLVGMISDMQLEMRSGRQEEQNTIRSEANVAETDRSRDLDDPEIERIMRRICQFARAMTTYRHSKNAQLVIEDIGSLLGLLMKQSSAISLSRDELPKKRKILGDYEYSELETEIQSTEDLAKAKRVLTASEWVRVSRQDSWRTEEGCDAGIPFSNPAQCRLPEKVRRGRTSKANFREIVRSWVLGHARVVASLQTLPFPDAERYDREQADEAFAAKVVVTPITTIGSKFQIIVDLASKTYQNRMVHFTPTLTFRAMIPPDSEVFRVVQRGSVNKLKKLLSSGAASLGDCDPAGRSLLNFALYKCRRKMTAFLIQSGADVDALELYPGTDLSESWMRLPVKPLNILSGGLDIERSDEDLERADGCYKLLLDADADLTSIALHEFVWGDYWTSAYSDTLISGSFVKLKALLDIGEPFISLESTGDDHPMATFPLQLLAHYHCGRNGSNFQIPDKVALLLSRGANVEARNHRGETCLHVVCSDHFARGKWPCSQMKETYTQRHLSESIDILISMISAGADVCALDGQGRSVSDVAFSYGQEVAWTKALKYCGIDISDVLARPSVNPARSTALSSPCNGRPMSVTSKLSLAEYLKRRKPCARLNPLIDPYWGQLSSSEDDDSENGDHDRDESEYGDWEDASDDETYDDNDDEDGSESGFWAGREESSVPENGQSGFTYGNDTAGEKTKLD